MSRKNPVIYISGPEVTYETFESLALDLHSHFKRIVDSLEAKNIQGEIISISLNIDDLNLDKVSAYARRYSSKTAEYEIYLSGGFIHYLWTASRIVSTNCKFISWIKRIKIDKSLKGKGRKEVLSDFAFHILLYNVLLHELAHIYLGHCDFIQSRLKFTKLHEFEGNGRNLTSEEANILKAIEADADRQAGIWLMEFIQDALGSSGRGKKVVFPSIPAFYEFLVLSLTIGNILNQQLTARMDPVHPLPNQRQYTAVSAVLDYVNKYKTLEYKILSLKVYEYTKKFAKKTGLQGLKNDKELLETAKSMYLTDTVLRKIGISQYQHKF